eukprot:5086064-Pyramimonas_sp.AAC.1
MRRDPPCRRGSGGAVQAVLLGPDFDRPSQMQGRFDGAKCACAKSVLVEQVRLAERGALARTRAEPACRASIALWDGSRAQC